MDAHELSRRKLLLQTGDLALLAGTSASAQVVREPGVKLKLALNAYSFDKPLRAGSMTLEDVVHFCAQHRVDALDATGYYFPGYPDVPADSYLFSLKRLAYVNGVQISGTGVRNNFTDPDASIRKRDIQMVRVWIEAASKLGASVLRVFSGPPQSSAHSFDEVCSWMVPAFQECTEHAIRHGVLLGLQHHNDFLKTADETIRVIKAVNQTGQPNWFGNVLDIGSLRQGDPYTEIEKLTPYALSWQIKEQVYYGTKEVPTDLRRIKDLIDKTGYRGVLPFEALGGGDPRVTVAGFLEQIRSAFSL